MTAHVSKATRRPLLIGARLIAYFIVSVLAGVVIGITAYLEYIQHWKATTVYLLPFVSGIVTLVIVLPLAILDRLRKDAAIHHPRVELVWAGLMMLLWLAAAMYFTMQMQSFPSCKIYKGLTFDWNYDSEETWCRLHYVLEGILWVIFVILFLNIVGIFVFAAINTEKGYGDVWSTAIPDFERDPHEAPSAQFIREREERQQELEETLRHMQRRYEASLAESNLEMRTGRPPSPTLSVRSQARSVGILPEAFQRNGSYVTARSGNTPANTSTGALHHGGRSSHSVLSHQAGTIHTPETANRVYGAAF